MADAAGSVNPFLIFCGLSFVFLSLSVIRYVFVVFTIWSLALGVALGFLLLSNFPEIPNLLVILSPLKCIEALSKYSSDVKINERKRGCSVCGSAKCSRHRPEVSFHSLNPWEELLIPQPVDQALTEFFEILLRTHVYSWYWELSHDQGFVDETRKNIRFLVAVLIRRIQNINIPKFVLTKCLRRFMIHLDCYARTRERVIYGEDIQAAVLNALGSQKHFVVESESAEADYMRFLVENLFPFILPPKFLKCRSASILLRELMTNIILLPTTEKIADPDFVNQLLLILLDDEPLKEPTKPPSPNVTLLEGFAKPRSKHANSALNLSVFGLIHDPTLLFPFMQFMRKEGALNVLQFCLDVEDFNKRSLAPELSEEEEKGMLKEAKEVYSSYFNKEAVDKINFPESIVADFREAISSPTNGRSRLSTAEPLFKAYEFALNLIEDTFAPLFHQSDEFYRVLCGPRVIEQPKKEPAKILKKRFMPLAELSKLANKIKARKRSAKEDKALAIFLDEIETTGTPPELVDEEEEDVEDFTGEIMNDEMEESGQIDLSYWHITVPRIDSIFERNKKVYVFVIDVNCIGTKEGLRSEEKWQLMRKYNEFFVLDSKLRQFHGSLNRTELPAKRTILKKDLDFLATCRLPFQEYLQSLVRNPVLRGSGLLHIFLSPGSQITGMFEPESMGREAGRKIKNIKSKLSIERGQNLEEFLQAFLVSAEPVKKKIPPRPQAEKLQRSAPKTKRSSKLFLPQKPWTNISRNKTVQESLSASGAPQTVTDYIIYAARTILKVSSLLHHLLVLFRLIGKNTLDAFTEKYLSYKVSLATQEDQLVCYIHLLRDAIFFDMDHPRTDTEKLARRDETLSKMLQFLPDPVKKVIGTDSHENAIRLLFEILQHPKLNKQLLYTLFDELVFELFPELVKQDSSQEFDGKDQLIN